MANLLRATPHSVIPGLLTPQTQSADFKKYLGVLTKYGEMGDDYLYITTASTIASDIFVGQQWGKNLARQNYALGQVQVAYYNIEAMLEWNTQEQAKFEKLSNGVGLPNFLENLAKQGINQKRHQAVLFGFDNSNNNALGQGILNNSVIKTMPQDSTGNKTLTTYNVSELLKFLVNCARSVMDASYNMTKPVVIASSVRVVNYLKSVLVPLTQYADTGSVKAIGGVYDKVVGDMLGVGTIEWVADNLLMGTPNDTIVFIAPGIDTQDEQGEDSANLVGKDNSILYNTFMDMVGGLIDLPNPPQSGWYGKKLVCKTTSGVNLRQDCVVQVPVQFV